MSGGDNLYPVIRSATQILLIVVIFAGCMDLSWNPPKPGTVVAELTNPDKSMTARIIATEVQGSYIFEIRRTHRGIIIAKQMISAPVGYHEHIVSITWNDDGQSFSATIDHDFGEDNRVFNISTMDSGA
jgi:hypothetical protein